MIAGTLFCSILEVWASSFNEVVFDITLLNVVASDILISVIITSAYQYRDHIYMDIKLIEHPASVYLWT